MPTLDQFHRNLLSIDIWNVLTPLLIKREYEFIEANKEQLLAGETNKGEMIHPKYTEDDYFPYTTPKGRVVTALGYARMKKVMEDKGLIPKPKIGTKYFTAPNFYLVGKLHSNLRMTVLKEGLSFDAEGFGHGFDTKWKDIYGVSKQNLVPILDDDLVSELRDELLKAMAK